MPGWVPGWLPAQLSYCLTACLIRGGVVTCLGRAFPCRSARGDCTVCVGGSAIPRKVWNCLSYCLPGKLNCLLPQGEGEHLPDCLPGKLIEHLPIWEAKLLPSPGGRWGLACLPAWEATKPWEELGCVDTPVIFPSFLFSKLLNLFSCLCLTLVNLISSTFSMKPRHSLSLCADKIDANCDLHSSVCLPTLSRIQFIALSLAWSKSFSAILIIF